jgi:hypothetical protein
MIFKAPTPKATTRDDGRRWTGGDDQGEVVFGVGQQVLAAPSLLWRREERAYLP